MARIGWLGAGAVLAGAASLLIIRIANVEATWKRVYLACRCAALVAAIGWVIPRIPTLAASDETGIVLMIIFGLLPITSAALALSIVFFVLVAWIRPRSRRGISSSEAVPE